MYIFIFFRVQPQTRPSRLNMMAFCPEHPKWDQNPKFIPLSGTTSIPTPFIWGVPPDNSELKQRRFSATLVNRKWIFFFFFIFGRWFCPNFLTNLLYNSKDTKYQFVSFKVFKMKKTSLLVDTRLPVDMRLSFWAAERLVRSPSCFSVF